MGACGRSDGRLEADGRRLVHVTRGSIRKFGAYLAILPIDWRVGFGLQQRMHRRPVGCYSQGLLIGSYCATVAAKAFPLADGDTRPGGLGKAVSEAFW